MSQSAGAVRDGLVLRFSIPASGEFRALVTEVAAKLAAQLGVQAQGDGGIAHIIDDLARRVGASDDPAAAAQGFSSADVAFEFHKLNGELKIEARSNDRSSEARIPLPA